MYAATNQGLYRHSDRTGSGAWTLVLKPDPNPTGSPYDTSFITDVAIKPGTHGQVVLAALALAQRHPVQRLLPVHHRWRRGLVLEDHPDR